MLDLLGFPPSGVPQALSNELSHTDVDIAWGTTPGDQDIQTNSNNPAQTPGRYIYSYLP